MRRWPLRLLSVALLCLLPNSGQASPAYGRFQVEEAEFVLRLADGRVLRGDDLVGVTLRLSSGEARGDLSVTGVDEDETATGDRIVLYRLSSTGPGDAADLCRPDIRGRRLGLPLPSGDGGFDFVCTSGAAGKCALMGYRPWKHSDYAPLPELHRACVHMLRADYGGDDRPTTRDGTAVDIYDRFGIQSPAMRHDMQFEAAWAADGAVCVAHPRIREHVTLAELEERYPRLAGHLGQQACTEDAMRAVPRALLFNRSASPD